MLRWPGSFSYDGCSCRVAAWFNYALQLTPKTLRVLGRLSASVSRMKEPAPNPSLFGVLAAIQQRPGMYVGGSDADYATQLDRLDMLIQGYLIALRSHQIEDDGAAAYRAFPDYLAKRFGWSMSQGPIRAIRHATPSDREAWDLFWKLLDDYRSSPESTTAVTGHMPAG